MANANNVNNDRKPDAYQQVIVEYHQHIQLDNRSAKKTT